MMIAVMPIRSIAVVVVASPRVIVTPVVIVMIAVAVAMTITTMPMRVCRAGSPEQ